jgi:hypothetical protein
MASLGQADSHSAHRVQVAESMEWGRFLSPLIAPTGHFCRQTPHPVHFSATI